MTIEAVDPAAEADALGDVLYATVLAGGSVHFLDTLSPEDARDYWRGIRGRAVLVARDEHGRIVGTASLILDSPPNQPHRAEVAKMLVHPDARRRGVARALLHELEALARREKRTLLTLDTVAGREAEGLYRSMGYELAGTIPDYAFLPDGSRLVATHLYFKRI